MESKNSCNVLKDAATLGGNYILAAVGYSVVGGMNGLIAYTQVRHNNGRDSDVADAVALIVSVASTVIPALCMICNVAAAAC